MLPGNKSGACFLSELFKNSLDLIVYVVAGRTAPVCSAFLVKLTCAEIHDGDIEASDCTAVFEVAYDTQFSEDCGVYFFICANGFQPFHVRRGSLPEISGTSLVVELVNAFEFVIGFG